MTLLKERATGRVDRASVRPIHIGSIDTSTPALVLTASPSARRSPHGGIGIIRSLGRLGIPVFTVDSDPRGPASYSRYLSGRFVVDLAGVSPRVALERLLEVGARIGSRPVLIPTWDEASLLVSDLADDLGEVFRFPRQPHDLARSLASKREMFHLARAHGVPTPDAIFPRTFDDLIEFADRATYPVMLKGISGNRLSERTGRKMVIVKRRDELVRLYREMEDPDEPNLMVQEYIPGGEDVVWMFNGYFDERSDCLVGITGRKLRQTPVYTGATSLGICLRNDEVDETTRRWMKELGYRGILDIGYRFDARDGQYKVLDVNPRIGGTFRLFVGGNGMDVARALYLDLTGQPVPLAEPVEGRKWMDERDVISSLQYRRDGRLGLRAWAGSLRGVRETVYFARDDPAPMLRAYLHGARPSPRPSATEAEQTSQRTGRPRLTLAKSSPGEHQAVVDTLFESTARDWVTIYDQPTVYGRIHQERRATALEWIDALGLPRGACVLEIGCGAGLTSVALASRGFDVTAVDRAPAMIELTDTLARERGLADRVHAMAADAHDLPFPDREFDLVLALGVFPWLHSPDTALREFVRVLQPGGYLISNVSNALRLHYLLDPRLNPMLAVPRRVLGPGLRRAGILRRAAPAPARLDLPYRFGLSLERAGLERERAKTYGFGPFTLWGRRLFSDHDGLRLHRSLQGLADRGVPVIRSMGAQHLVQARKRPVAGGAAEPPGGLPGGSFE
jgi:D-aspartate ligase